MSDRFDYDDIIASMQLARADGLEPTQLHLGYEETHELLSDANFTTAGGAPPSNSGIGVVAGIDVQQAPMEHLKVMTAQHDDELAYYLL